LLLPFVGKNKPRARPACAMWAVVAPCPAPMHEESNEGSPGGRTRFTRAAGRNNRRGAANARPGSHAESPGVVVDSSSSPSPWPPAAGDATRSRWGGGEGTGRPKRESSRGRARSARSYQLAFVASPPILSKSSGRGAKGVFDTGKKKSPARSSRVISPCLIPVP
jgi:hypothetical protein